MALLDDFKARFTEIDEATADRLVPFLADVWPAYYGGSYDSEKEAILNLVAHLVVVEEGGKAAVKSVASQSVGSVSVSFASQPSGTMDEFFMGSKYGQRFLLLTAKNRGAMFV